MKVTGGVAAGKREIVDPVFAPLDSDEVFRLEPGPHCEVMRHDHEEDHEGEPVIPVWVFRRAIREIEEGKLDEKIVARLAGISPRSAAFRKRYLDIRCDSYLRSVRARSHRAPSFVPLASMSLNGSGIAAGFGSGAGGHPVVGNAGSLSPKMRPSQPYAENHYGPWMVRSFADLFRHYGFGMTLLGGSGLFLAIESFRVVDSLEGFLPRLAITLATLLVIVSGAILVRGCIGLHRDEAAIPVFGSSLAFAILGGAAHFYMANAGLIHGFLDTVFG